MAIYPQAYENKIGFDRIREHLSNGCLCELGKEKVGQMKFLADYDEVSFQLRLANEMKHILTYEENFPQDNYFDARKNVGKMQIEGATPEVNDLIVIRNSLSALIALFNFFKGAGRNEKYPELSAQAASIATFPEITKEVDRIVDKNSQVKDGASQELRNIRGQIKQKQNEVTRKLQNLLRKAKSDGIVEDDVEITFRNNRPVIPVPANNKRVLGGMMHDESGSGKTAFIEPGEVVELNNKVRELQIAEHREIQKILRAFADYIRPDIDSIISSYSFLAEIDFSRAKARFAKEINAVKPILNNVQGFNWKNAVHPLLYLQHTRENKEVVPLNIYLNEDNRLLIISGPNAGGKSVCLKTVGLLQYMLQCGILVPMGENSEAGVFSSIFIDIGDEQSIDNDLSTYSGHLENMKYFVKRADNKTLVLIDEFGTGTEPALGGAIAEAVLEKLFQEQAFGVITTHYANLKHYASETKGIMNGAMLFDTQSIRPLYQLSIGKPGSSFAIDIARKIGLPEDILKSASDKVGEEHFIYDKQLREIARDKAYWEGKRQRIRKVEKTLDNLYDKYNSELDSVQKERKAILREAKAEARKILNEANAKVEKTIRGIREVQAEKEKTKALRQNLVSFKNNFDKGQDSRDKFDKKKKELENAGKNLSKYSTDLKQAKINQKKEKKKSVTLEPGDKVKIKGADSVGEIIKIDGKQATIAFGSMLTTIKVDNIETGDIPEAKKRSTTVKIDQSITSRKLNFKPEIDVRGQRADDALTSVQHFFDEAIMANAKEVAVLHGKGNGILRQLIRDYAASLNYVKRFSDAHADRGGAGITIVTFDY